MPPYPHAELGPREELCSPLPESGPDALEALETDITERGTSLTESSIRASARYGRDGWHPDASLLGSAAGGVETSPPCGIAAPLGRGGGRRRDPAPRPRGPALDDVILTLELGPYREQTFSAERLAELERGWFAYRKGIMGDEPNRPGGRPWGFGDLRPTGSPEA